MASEQLQAVLGVLDSIDLGGLDAPGAPRVHGGGGRAATGGHHDRPG